MLNISVINATKVYPWKSETWPITETFSGGNFIISGEVTENFEFQIRKQTQLNTYLQNKTSADVSAQRRAIRIKFISAKNSQGQAVSYNQIVSVFENYVKSTNEDLVLESRNNLLDIYAPSTVIADLRSRAEEGVATPLHPGTKLTFVTHGSTPFCDSASIVVDKALDVDLKWTQKNADVEEGMLDFARKYQQLSGASENKKVAQSDDDEWD